MTALAPGLSSVLASSMLAAGEWKYWLPPQNSTHGDAMDSLPGVMWHLSDAWRRRHEPNIVLVHYADLSADLAGEIAQHRQHFPQRRGARHFGVPRHRADDHALVVYVDARETLDLAEVDDVGRGGETLFQSGDQRLPAGEKNGVFAIGTQLRSVVEAGRAVVVEAVHAHSPLHARQTRSGVAGIATSFTPIASVTAFMIAAGAAMAPASPQPFTPSGLCVQAVTVVSTVKFGRSSARGMQ